MLARFLRAATTTPQVAASPLALRPLVAACGAALPSRAASTAGVAAAPMPPLSELLPVRAAKPARKQPRAPVPASGPKAPLVADHKVIRAAYEIDANGQRLPSTVPGEAAGQGEEEFTLPPDPTRKFAVFSFGGTQYKVTAGDILNVEHVKGVAPGDVLTIPAESIHVVGTASRTLLGRPSIPGSSITLEVREQALDKKVIIFKKQRRKRHVRRAGHRRMVTVLEVVAVDADMDAF